MNTAVKTFAIPRPDPTGTHGSSRLAGRHLPLAVHPLPSTAIVINYPGMNGTIDGYEGKHAAIAESLRERGIGAVVRTENVVMAGESYVTDVEVVLRTVIEYALQRATQICGVADPDLYLIGTSAGAGTAATVAADYGAKKMLLVVPASFPTKERVAGGLRRYAGDLNVLAGEADQWIWMADFIEEHAVATPTPPNIQRIPGADHHFSAHEATLRSSALWAFSGMPLAGLDGSQAQIG